MADKLRILLLACSNIKLATARLLAFCLALLQVHSVPTSQPLLPRTPVCVEYPSMAGRCFAAHPKRCADRQAHFEI